MPPAGSSPSGGRETTRRGPCPASARIDQRPSWRRSAFESARASRLQSAARGCHSRGNRKRRGSPGPIRRTSSDRKWSWLQYGPRDRRPPVFCPQRRPRDDAGWAGSWRRAGSPLGAAQAFLALRGRIRAGRPPSSSPRRLTRIDHLPPLAFRIDRLVKNWHLSSIDLGTGDHRNFGYWVSLKVNGALFDCDPART
jgi:hypothetical protein